MIHKRDSAFCLEKGCETVADNRDQLCSKHRLKLCGFHSCKRKINAIKQDKYCEKHQKTKESRIDWIDWSGVAV